MGPETKQNRTKRVSRVLCAAGPRGSAEAIDALVGAATERSVQALALVVGGGSAAERFAGPAPGAAVRLSA